MSVVTTPEGRKRLRVELCTMLSSLPADAAIAISLGAASELARGAGFTREKFATLAGRIFEVIGA